MLDITDTRISVSEELKEHYNLIVRERNNILDSAMTEDKDRAAILRVTTDILKEFSKVQQEVYNSENFAILTQVVIDTLKEESAELCERVIARYDRKLEDLKELENAK